MKCNRACSYCFAKEKLYEYSKTNRATDISLEDLNRVIQFLARSNCNVVQLAGGEPTVHPKFKEILLTLIESNFRVNLLSNATWNQNLNSIFEKISPNSLGFLLNIDQKTRYNTVEWATIEQNLDFLSKRSNVTLSFNFFEKQPKYEYFLDLLSRYGFKNVRLSFSMPVTFGDKKNTYLEIESYKQTAKYLIDFVRRVENFGARVGLDNTVPICMFSSEELAELMLKQVIEPSRNFVCYPALDIGPDLSLWRCFGTSKLFNKKLDDFESVEEAYAYYIRQSRLYQFKFMPFNECETCEHALKERCQGGCIGFADIKSKEMGLAVEDLTDEQILKMKLSLSKNTRIKEYDLPKRTFIISSPQNNTEMEIQPALAELLRLLNGVNTVNDVVQLQVKNSTGSQERDELDCFLQEIANKKMLPLIRGLLDKKLLLEENNDTSSILG